MCTRGYTHECVRIVLRVLVAALEQYTKCSDFQFDKFAWKTNYWLTDWADRRTYSRARHCHLCNQAKLSTRPKLCVQWTFRLIDSSRERAIQRSSPLSSKRVCMYVCIWDMCTASICGYPTGIFGTLVRRRQWLKYCHWIIICDKYSGSSVFGLKLLAG